MTLIRYGFFQELKHGDPNGLRLTELRGKATYDAMLKVKILSYLGAGYLIVGCPGVFLDVLSETAEVVGMPGIFTDGTWVWPGDLPYYVGRYGVPIPDEMLRTMKHHEWIVPQIDDISSL